MSDKIELFRVESEEYEEYTGKAKDMVQSLMEQSDSFEIHKSADDNMVIVFYKKGDRER